MHSLTKRETEVMRHLCDGLTAQGIGERMGLSSRTVETHKANAIRKLEARNQTHAAVLFDRAQGEMNTPDPMTAPDLIAMDADLIVPDTLADSDGDDGA